MNLKEFYNQDFLQKLAIELAKYDQKFPTKKFLTIPIAQWSELELKQRMRFISLRIHKFLSEKNFPKQLEILKKTANTIQKDKNSQLTLIIFPDFIEVFGREHFQISMRAFEFFTEFGSAEFAVRKFIEIDCEAALKFFTKWVEDRNFYVRRLASEGVRPRLPWGVALSEFKKNPKPILPILEKLKFDESEYVRRSVANNLNDISKDHPVTVLETLKQWKCDGVNARLIKHALRTLLKRGDKSALELIGIKDSEDKKFSIQNFALQKAEIRNSENLSFSFDLESSASDAKIRLEYAIYFLQKSGSHGKKIFQITTKNFSKGVFTFSKKHPFRDLTTRKHYSGEHMISLIVNGVELVKLQFFLTKK